MPEVLEKMERVKGIEPSSFSLEGTGLNLKTQ